MYQAFPFEPIHFTTKLGTEQKEGGGGGVGREGGEPPSPHPFPRPPFFALAPIFVRPQKRGSNLD